MRRYTVGQATTGELVAAAAHPRAADVAGRRLHERRAVPDARELRAAERRARSIRSTTATAARHAYVGVHGRSGSQAGHRRDGGALRRCIETCQADSDCDAGYGLSERPCMEGIEPPQACVNAPQRVRAARERGVRRDRRAESASSTRSSRTRRQLRHQIRTRARSRSAGSAERAGVRSDRGPAHRAQGATARTTRTRASSPRISSSTRTSSRPAPARRPAAML